MRRSLSHRSVLVTGGRGFVGRSLTAALRRRGVEPWTVARTPSREGGMRDIVIGEGRWDAALDRVLAEVTPDCVFHLAGRARGTAPELAAANVGLLQCLLDALARAGLRPRLVVAGSAAEYGAAIRDGEPARETAECAPRSAYGATKLAQTRAALAFAEATGAPTLVARIFNPIGPGMPPHLALQDFANQIWSMPRTGGTLRVGDIDVRRDMIDVEHVGACLAALADDPRACGIVNLCSGQAPPLRELVEMLIMGSGRTVEIAIDRSRLRPDEPRTIVGSLERLSDLGHAPPPTDFPAVIARISRAMDTIAALTP